MSTAGPLRRRLGGAITAAVAAAALSACGSSGSTSHGGGAHAGGASTSSAASIPQTGPGLTEPTHPEGTRIRGGTVTFAEAPGSPPDYIFPGVSAQYCSIANVTNFNTLMYRPLYWYGDDYSPTVDFDASVADAPTWSTVPGD